MRTITFVGLLIFAGIISSNAQEMLQIEITNIKNSTGTIMVGLFSTEETFLKEAAIGRTVKAANQKVSVTFENVPAGEYAISIIHDENENGALDSNFLGMPKEGFGFGNDAIGTFGPPSFDRAKVKINGQSAKHVIKMRYL